MIKEFQDKSPPIYDTQSEIKSDFEEFTYHPDIDSNFSEDVDDDLTNDQVDEELGDDIIESSTLIFPKATPVTTEINDVFPKDNTQFLPKSPLLRSLSTSFLKMLHATALVKYMSLTYLLLALHFHN